MDHRQQQLAHRLVASGLNRAGHVTASTIIGLEITLDALDGLNDVHFAWMGGLERRQRHCYCLQMRRFLVEYDNTQNDANHIHSARRDPANGFGAHLLAQHYARAHQH